MGGIAARLAADFLEASSLSCLHAEPRSDAVKVSVGGLAARKAPGVRVWVRSERRAEAVLAEMLSSCPAARRIRGGLKVAAPIEQVAELVHLCARRLGYVPTADEHLDVTLDSLERRIGAAIAKMKSTGAMKRLSDEYTELSERHGRAHRKAAKRTLYDARHRAFHALPKGERDRVKAEFKASGLSWAKFLEQAIPASQLGGTSAGDMPETAGTSLPPYSEWLVQRLKKQLSSLHQSGAITNL
jgi:hypothetical protein